MICKPIAAVFLLTLIIIPGSAAAQSVDLSRLVQHYHYARQSGATEQALEFARKALALGESEFGEHSPELIELIDNLAQLLLKNQAYAEAEQLLKRSLAIQQQMLGGEHPELVNTLHPLAEIAFRQDRYQEAEAYYRRIVAIDEQAFGEDHFNVAADLEPLMRLYRASGRKAQAELLAERVAEIYLQPSLTDIARQRSAQAPPGSSPSVIELGDGDRNFSVVRVFYGTNRARTGSLRAAQFYGGDRGELAFGHVDVSIPKIHQYGELESPYWTFFGAEGTPTEHILILSMTPLKPDAFFAALSERMDTAWSRDLFVFIHGYNVSFDKAARRVAQIAYDLNFGGTPVLYSWPSRDGTASYMADEASARISARRLRVFLEALVERSAANRIHLIAHSMGNRVLLDALEQIVLRRDQRQPLQLFDQIILAAPDVDIDLFTELVPDIEVTAKRVTLYASENDQALNLSTKLHGGVPRAGLAGPHIVTVAGVDTVDMSDVSTNFLGHSYYGDSEAVISDILTLFWRGMPPPDRCGMDPQSKQEQTYWFFQPASCTDKAYRNAVVLLNRFGPAAHEQVATRIQAFDKQGDAVARKEWMNILRKIEELLPER